MSWVFRASRDLNLLIMASLLNLPVVTYRLVLHCSVCIDRVDILYFRYSASPYAQKIDHILSFKKIPHFAVKVCFRSSLPVILSLERGVYCRSIISYRDLRYQTFLVLLTGASLYSLSGTMCTVTPISLPRFSNVVSHRQKDMKRSSHPGRVMAK